MAVHTETTPPRRSEPPVGRRVAVGIGELVFSAALLLLYFFLRGVRPDDVEPAVRRSIHLIRLQDRTGLFWEPTLQSVAAQHAWIIDSANLIYAWGMFPLIGVIAVWLVFTDVERFRFIRNVMLVSGVVGLVCYWVFPTAPPRLLASHGYDFGFVDTVYSETSNANYFQPGPLVNHYAALPSFHFGWVALMAAAIWFNTKRALPRVFAIVFPVVMFVSIIITANHFIFDMVMGAAIVGLSWLFVDWLHEEPRAVWLRELVRSRGRPRARPRAS